MKDYSSDAVFPPDIYQNGRCWEQIDEVNLGCDWSGKTGRVQAPVTSSSIIMCWKSAHEKGKKRPSSTNWDASGSYMKFSQWGWVAFGCETCRGVWHDTSVLVFCDGGSGRAFVVECLHRAKWRSKSTTCWGKRQLIRKRLELNLKYLVVYWKKYHFFT